MNWGNKLICVFIIFAVGMGYLVYRAVNTDFELVEKDYYKNELQYQQVIDATNRGNQLSAAVKLKQSATGITVQLPEEMKGHTRITGDIWFYCAYDEKRDKKFSLQPDTSAKQIIAPELIKPGNYTVKINWNREGKNYFTEQPVTIL